MNTPDADVLAAKRQLIIAANPDYTEAQIERRSGTAWLVLGPTELVRLAAQLRT